jgi:uncharacterized membrane protein
MAEPNLENEVSELRQLLSEVIRRLERIERVLKIQSGWSQTAPPPAPLPRVSIAAPEPAESRPFPYIPPPSSPQATLPSSDLESRIGSHWLNRIGIAAVLVGVSYFLKYAFENNWIGPAGRVLIGLAAGVAVILWSERFRGRGYLIFSYSLKALGMGVLYLSLWAAYQVYSLISGGIAFVAMLLVTAATAAMAILQDARILALFALMGGFVTPLLLSTGKDRELDLFSYLAVLDAATLLLLTVKLWRRLMVLGFLGTLFHYIAWYEIFYDRGHFHLTLGFATLFFAIFAVAPIVVLSTGESKPGAFWAIPHVIAFSNAVAYFIQVYVMFQDTDARDSTWVACGLAAVYVFLSRQVQPRQRATRAGESLRLLHLALSIGFITIAIPIGLESHWITVGWLVEAAALLWLGDRIHSSFLSIFALGALVLGIARLVLVDNFYSPRPLLNARMGVHLLAIAVLALVAWRGFQKQDENARKIAVFCVIAANVLAIIALSREVSDYYQHAIAAQSPLPGQWIPRDWSRARSLRIARDFTYSALWMFYGALLMLVGFRRHSAFVRWQSLVLIALTIVKVFVYDVWQLDRGYRIVSFVILGILLLAISFAYQRDWLRLSRA